MEGKIRPYRSHPFVAALVFGAGLCLFAGVSHADPNHPSQNFGGRAKPRSPDIPIAPIRIVVNIFDAGEDEAQERGYRRVHGLEPRDAASEESLLTARGEPLALSLGDEGLTLSVGGIRTLGGEEPKPGNPLSSSAFSHSPNKSPQDGLALEFSRKKFTGMSYYVNEDFKVTLTGRVKRLLEFNWQIE